MNSGTRTFLFIFTCLAAGAVSVRAADDPPSAATGSLLILDDSDEEFGGKAAYEDGLTQIRADGGAGFRVTGLNTCQTVGSNHQVTVDQAREWVWMSETVANRVRKLDRKGKELLALEDVPAGALAVDAATGNLWALLSGGTIYSGSVVVLDPKGNALARHAAAGFDIAHDAKDGAFWVCGKSLTKIDAKSGKFLVELPVAEWCAISVACDADHGRVWVAVRQHPDVKGSVNELLCFDRAGAELLRIPLGEDAPFKVCVDGKSGDAWVCVFGTAMLRYAPSGELKLRHAVLAITADLDPATGDLWVVTREEVLRLNGKAEVLKKVMLARRTEQAWCVWF